MSNQSSAFILGKKTSVLLMNFKKSGEGALWWRDARLQKGYQKKNLRLSRWPGAFFFYFYFCKKLPSEHSFFPLSCCLAIFFFCLFYSAVWWQRLLSFTRSTIEKREGTCGKGKKRREIHYIRYRCSRKAGMSQTAANAEKNVKTLVGILGITCPLTVHVKSAEVSTHVQRHSCLLWRVCSLWNSHQI